MLLEDKINLLLSEEPSYIDKSSDIITTEVQTKGKIQEEVLVMNDILYYLLDLKFTYKNINLELYKYLKHLLDTIEILTLTSSYVPVPETIVTTITTNVGDTPLDFGTVRVGNYNVLNFTFEASAAFDKVLISTNPEYLISNDPIIGFTTDLQFYPTPLEGVIATKTVYVKYVPSNEGTDINVLTISVEGAADTIVNLTGTGVVSTLGANPFTLNYPVTRVNTPSSYETFGVTGTYLISDVVIASPIGFTLSLTPSNYTNSITIHPDIYGDIPLTVIYVIFTPTQSISYNNLITISNSEIAANPVNVTGIGTQIRLTVSPLEIDLGNIYIGDIPSYPYPSFNIEGIELVSDVVVTVPNSTVDYGAGYSVVYNYTDMSSIQHTSTTSYSIPPLNGTINVDNSILFTGFNALGNISFPLVVSSANVASSTVVVKANLCSAIITFTPHSINFGNIVVNQKAETMVHLSGSGLSAQITVACFSSVFTFSTTSMNTPGTAFLNFSYFNTTNGVIDIDIYVQSLHSTSGLSSVTLSANTVNTIGFASASDSILVQSTGVVPTIIALPTTMGFPSTAINTASNYISSSISGTNLVGNVTVTAPTGFTVCQTSNGTYTSSISYTDLQVETGVTIYVKFNPTLVQSYSDSVTLTSSLASTVNIAVNGSGLPGTPVVTVAYTGDYDLGSDIGWSNVNSASQQIVNSVNAIELTELYMNDFTSPSNTVTVDVYNQASTLLYSVSKAGINTGGFHNYSPASPVPLVAGEILNIVISTPVGTDYLIKGHLNAIPYPYTYNAIIDGVAQDHPIGIQAIGNLY